MGCGMSKPCGSHKKRARAPGKLDLSEQNIYRITTDPYQITDSERRRREGMRQRAQVPRTVPSPRGPLQVGDARYNSTPFYQADRHNYVKKLEEFKRQQEEEHRIWRAGLEQEMAEEGLHPWYIHTSHQSPAQQEYHVPGGFDWDDDDDDDDEE